MKKQALTFLCIFVMSCGSVVFAQEKTNVDQRALNKYSANQLQEAGELKIRQINWFYNESFIIPREFAGVITPSDVDIKRYDHSRKPDEQAKVYLTNETMDEKNIKGSGEYIILKSINEVRAAYKQIEEAYKLENKSKYLTTEENQPEGFPVFKDTGDRQKDKERFEKEQEEFYRNQSK